MSRIYKILVAKPEDDYMGDLDVYGRTRGSKKKKNRLSGCELDLTGSQYGPDVGNESSGSIRMCAMS
jgi:hypothetical protein